MTGEAHLYNLIDEYEKFKRELNALPIYNGYDDFYRRENDGERQRLANALKEIEQSIYELVNRDHVELAGENITIVIARLKEKRPQDDRRLARIINARGQQMM